jgi:hypothetical protein
MTIEAIPDALEGATPRVTKAPRRFRPDEGGAGVAPPKLLDRIVTLRGEAFDLVRELRERDEESGGEYERASMSMQSVANQLAAVQALLTRDRA